jgi:hypothetical protein
VAAVRHPAGALAGPQTFPNSAQSAFGHAESCLRSHCRLAPAIHVLVTEALQDVDARDNPRSSPGGMAVEDDSTTSERPLLFGPLSVSRKSGR